MIKAKRFWSDVHVTDHGQITLDERLLKTPEKRELIAPSLALAEAIAQEWRDIEGEIDAASTPLTKMANSAIDRIPQNRQAVETMLAEYAQHELITYREADNAELQNLQSQSWDQWIEFGRNFGFALPITLGIMGKDHDEDSVAIGQSLLRDYSDFSLVAIHEFITITGSFILGLAIAQNRLTATDGFALSRVDEDFQIAKWGRDEEAEALRESHRQAIMNAERFYQLLNPKTA